MLRRRIQPDEFVGAPPSVFSMIGLMMPMDLVTKNAILLVDFANQARQTGASDDDVQLQAGTLRMRPIIMKTAAMVFGMLPLALALNDGGEIHASQTVESRLMPPLPNAKEYRARFRLNSQERLQAQFRLLTGNARSGGDLDPRRAVDPG